MVYSLSPISYDLYSLPQDQSNQFSNAFAQAELKTPVYTQTPAKYHQPEWGPSPVLKLNRSFYGQVEAPRLWYEKLKKGLEDWGFTSSKVDPCMFLSPQDYLRSICR